MAKFSTYADLIESLALGFDLLDERKEKLSSQRSFPSKQSRYWDERPGGPAGLLPSVLAVLAGEDAALQDILHSLFQQYEHLLSHLCSRPLITPLSQAKVSEIFLRHWVLPQLAAVLHRFRTTFPASSPLHYVEALLPDAEEADYNPASRLRTMLKQRLPDTEFVSSFRTSLDKLDGRSNTKYRTILAELRKLAAGFPSEQAEQGNILANQLKPIYLAGMAVKRFAEQVPNGARAIRRHLDTLDAGPRHLLVSSLSEAHAGLLALLLKTARMPVDDYWEHGVFFGIWDLCERTLALTDPNTHPASAPVLHRVVPESGFSPHKLRHAMTRLERHPDRAQLEFILDYGHAMLALYGGSLEDASNRFRRIVEASRTRQLGEYAYAAAGHAIALQIRNVKHIPHGSLNELANVRIQSWPQSTTVNLPHPSVFGLAARPKDLDPVTRTIFLAIQAYNADMRWIGQPHYVNPYGHTEAFLENVFAVLDQKPHDAPGLCERQQGTRAFPMHSATVYESLRDVWFYTNQFFGEDLVTCWELNPCLLRFIRLSQQTQRDLLRSIDAKQFVRDRDNYRAEGGSTP
jgi:hypothetical protein